VLVDVEAVLLQVRSCSSMWRSIFLQA